MYEQHRDDIGPEPPPPPPPPPPEGAAEAQPDTRQRNLILGLVGAVLVALIAFLLGVVLDGGGDENVRASSTATTASPTTTEATLLPGVTPPLQTVPPTTVAPGVVNAVTGTPQLAAATTTTAKPSPTTTADPCHNSHDPKCGPFRWEPPPGPNEPLTVKVPCGPPQTCVPDTDTVQGTAGQSLNFHLVASDPDAKIDKTCIVIDWGDGTGATTGDCPPPPNCPTPYGPWVPPARVADSDDRPVFHTYESAGDYTATFRYQSVPSCDPNPYGGVATGSAKATVTPAP